MNSLMEMLAAAGAEERAPRREAPSSPPEVLCVTLREIAERYNAPCPFKVGDLVMPRNNYNMHGHGEPAVVIEVISDPIRNFNCVDDPSDHASMAYGAKLDVRVALERNGSIVAHWQESWALEPYTGPGSDAA